MISVKDAVDDLDRQAKAAAERERLLRKCLQFWQQSLSAMEEHVFPLFPGAAQKTEEDWQQVHACLQEDVPEAVLEKLVHAVEAPKPHARYYVTKPTHYMAIARRFLPQRVLDHVLDKASDQ